MVIDKTADVRYDTTKGAPVTASQRDRMLQVSVTDWHRQAGGYRELNHFISSAKVEELDAAGLVDNDFDNRPTLADLLAVGKMHSGAKYGGHMISPYREDCRITFDRITICGDLTDEVKAAFSYLAKTADEVTVEDNHLEAWWD
jgi:hypothetical protein